MYSNKPLTTVSHKHSPIDTSIKVGDTTFNCTCDEKGHWTYKSEDSKPIKKVNPVYQEKPRYPVLEEIDQQAHKLSKSWHKSLPEIVENILLNVK